MLVVGRGDKRRVAHAVQVPLAVLLDVDDGVAGAAGRAAVRGHHRGHAFLDGHVGGYETKRFAVDPQLQALVFREETPERLLDGRAPLELAAGQVAVFAVRRPEGGHGFGVAFLKGRDERLGLLGQGRHVLGVALGLLGRSLLRDERPQ